MQPQQFQPLQQQEATPSNYLDQIASPQQPANDKRFFIIIIVALVVGIILFVTLLSATGGSSKATSLERLALRLTSLESIAKNAQGKLKSSQLRSMNSALSTHLTNANRDIRDPLQSAGIDIKKVDSKLIAEESSVKITETLEDARLNAVYDQTYTREMSFQLERTVILMDNLQKGNIGSTSREFLESNYQNIKVSSDSFKDALSSVN